MKIEYLQKIIARIQNQIHCPKCKAAFVEESIEIKEVKGQQVDFSAECAHCKARSQISAQISQSKISDPVAPLSLHRKLSSFELPQSKVSADQLVPISQDLKNFKGSDIKALFE